MTTTETRALPDSHSPCRIDKDKGNRRHRCSPHHADLVESYRLAVEAQNLRAEAATHGYGTELAAYFDPIEGIEQRYTFRHWLESYR